MLHLRSFVVAFVCLVPILTFPAYAADPTPEFEAMATAGAAYINDTGSCPGIISAQTVFDNLDDYTVIDIRARSAYDMGHIHGAYHSSLATLIDDLNDIPNDKPYVIACYTGQSAGHAKIAMEMLGFEDVYSLLFGMSSWNTSLDYWSVNCGDNLAAPEIENQNDGLTVHTFPEITGSVEDRVESMLAAGYKGKSYSSIQDNLSDYFVINYFGVADYEGTGTSGVPGHIPGAFQFTPYQSLGIDQMLSNIPADMPVVVYSWTGQTESQLVAYLNMCGYEAYALKFGANNLFYSDLTAHKWGPVYMHDFPLSLDDPTAAPDRTPAVVTHLANHPNPFNPSTTIAYRLSTTSRVTLRVYDLSGRLVRELLAGADQGEGLHEVVWKGSDDAGRGVPSGTYLYRLDAGGQVETRRMALLK